MAVILSCVNQDGLELLLQPNPIQMKDTWELELAEYLQCNNASSLPVIDENVEHLLSEDDDGNSDNYSVTAEKRDLVVSQAYFQQIQKKMVESSDFIAQMEECVNDDEPFEKPLKQKPKGRRSVFEATTSEPCTSSIRESTPEPSSRRESSPGSSLILGPATKAPGPTAVTILKEVERLGESVIDEYADESKSFCTRVRNLYEKKAVSKRIAATMIKETREIERREQEIKRHQLEIKRRRMRMSDWERELDLNEMEIIVERNNIFQEMCGKLNDWRK